MNLNLWQNHDVQSFWLIFLEVIILICFYLNGTGGVNKKKLFKYSFDDGEKCLNKTFLPPLNQDAGQNDLVVKCHNLWLTSHSNFLEISFMKKIIFTLLVFQVFVQPMFLHLLEVSQRTKIRKENRKLETSSLWIAEIKRNGWE